MVANSDGSHSGHDVRAALRDLLISGDPLDDWTDYAQVDALSLDELHEIDSLLP